MRLAVIVAIVCVAGVGAVQAQDQETKASNQQQQAQQQSGMQRGAGQLPLITTANEKLVEGQILEYKDVSVENEKDHRVVQLKTKTGETIQVDLGVEDNLPRGFDLRKGQWVLVSGIYGRLGNNNVFVAHKWANVFNLTAGGGTPGRTEEALPGTEKEGQGGSEGKGDDSYHAQYRDYPGHVGESGPGANQPNKGEDSKQKHGQD